MFNEMLTHGPWPPCLIGASTWRAPAVAASRACVDPT